MELSLITVGNYMETESERYKTDNEYKLSKKKNYLKEESYATYALIFRGGSFFGFDAGSSVWPAPSTCVGSVSAGARTCFPLPLAFGGGAS